MQTYYEPRYYASSKRVILKLVRNKKLKITDEKMLETVDSPTGKVYIGVNKRPLQKVKKGYGYRGVLLQTDNRVFVQCHVCGLWMRRIAAKHLKAHKLTKDRYCEKFGLLKTTALVSDELSLSLEERGRKNIMAYNNLDAVKASKARQEQRKLAAEKVKKNRNRLVFKDEFANRYGLCEKQLGFRLIEYIRKYKSLPSSRNVKGEGNIIRKALAISLREKRRYRLSGEAMGYRDWETDRKSVV